MNILKFQLNLFDCEKIDTHGGSLRVYISKNKNKKKSKNFNKLLRIENKKFLKKQFINLR